MHKEVYGALVERFGRWGGGDNQSTKRKSCPSATLATTHPIWNHLWDLGTNWHWNRFLSEPGECHSDPRQSKIILILYYAK